MGCLSLTTYKTLYITTWKCDVFCPDTLGMYLKTYRTALHNNGNDDQFVESDCNLRLCAFYGVVECTYRVCIVILDLFLVAYCGFSKF